MQIVTTKAAAKVAAVATGLAMATSMMALAPIAHAAALSSTQVSAIITLLQSFGADAATVANVQASLTGGTPSTTTTTTTTGTPTCTFSQSLTTGATGSAVTCLQQTLIGAGYSIPAGATGYYGSQTVAAVAAWQKAKNIAPPVGYFGPISRAAFLAQFTSGSGSTTTTTTTGNTAGTGNGLKIMLASDSPNGVALVQGQAAGELAKFTFANPTSADIKVTNLGFNRTGVSNDSTMTNVYLYSGAVRLTDSAGVSVGAFNFNNSEGIFTVPAGQTYTISVRSDIDSSAQGQQIGVKLVSATSSGTLDSSVSFPVTGGLQTVSAATLANVDLAISTSPTVSSVDPQADYTVWQNTVTVGTRAVLMKSLALRLVGSAQSSDVINFRLYVDGVMAGNSVARFDSNNMVTFDLSASPVRLETGGRVLKVMADVVGGASRTFQMSLRYAADALFYDTDLSQPILVRGNGTSITAAFASHAATSATINSVSTSAPSVTRAADSPSAAVANSSSNVKWASFKIIANGEDLKVDNLNVTADTSSSGSGLDNGKVFLNGVQVGSTKDIAEYGGTTTNYTFGSSFIVKVGTTAVVDIYADAKTSASANLTAGETVKIYLGVGASNATGQVSLTSVNVPTSDVTGNSITVSASTLTANKASYYGNQTVIPGAQNMKIGAFTLSTGATEGVSVNTIEIGIASAVTSTMSDLVIKNHDTGATFGSSKATVGTTNSFSGAATIAKSGTQTFDIYANIKSGAELGAIPATTVTTNTTGNGDVTGSTVSVTSAPTLQTITIGAANLTVTQNSGSTPDDSIIVAGSSLVKVGTFRFTTQYSPYTVDQVAVKIPANAATAVSNVVLQYMDKDGNTKTTDPKDLALSSGGQTYATATFSGLTFYIPSDSNRDLNVYVNTPTIANSPSASGKQITVTLDANEGFNATDSAGTVDASLANADVSSNGTSGKGTMVVRKSFPTVTPGTAPSATLSAGSDQVLGTFNVTADAAGDVDWGQVVFTVSKNSALTIGATTTLAVWDVTNGSSQIDGTFATTSSTSLVGGLDALVTSTTGFLHFRPTTVRTVGAGKTAKYELRGTVGGIASGANNISVSIAAPSTSVSTAAFASAAGTLGVSTNASFVWSDWSDATNHAADATAASDWTSDYLVGDLPITIGNRSLNY